MHSYDMSTDSRLSAFLAVIIKCTLQQQLQHPQPAAAEGPLPEPLPPQLPPLPPPPPPLVEDLLLPGAAAPQHALPEPRSAARHLKGEAAEQLLRAWEFCCRFGQLLGLDESLLSDEQQQQHQAAEAGHGGTRRGAGGGGAEVRRAIEPLVLLQVMEDGLLAGASSGQLEAQGGAAQRVWEQLHAGLTRLLCGDAYSAAAAVLLRAGGGGGSGTGDARDAAPQVDSRTWAEAARRYLWGAAAAMYVSNSEAPAAAPRAGNAPGLAAAAPDLPGRLAALSAQDWAVALCGGGGGGMGGGSGLGPVGRGALLPAGASETAGAAAAAVDDAAALAAAAALVQRLAGEETGGGEGVEEGSAPAAAAQQQRRLQCRRLLQTLMSCRADKTAGTATGRSMCYYAAELGAMVRWHKALDLRGAAARLEAGLYDGADGMEVR